MARILPFFLFSLALHASGVLALVSLSPVSLGVAGSPDGDPDRVFVCVVAEEEVTAVAPVPSPVDSPAAVEAEKAEEKPVEQEPTPEILAREEPDFAADFSSTPVEEPPPPDPPEKEAEIKPKKQPVESAASTPQVASDVQKHRAALGKQLRNFQSLMMAAIRQAAFFPDEAVRKRQRGEVTVKFAITSEGILKLVEVVNTSGSSCLDEAAQEIIRRAVQNFPPVPRGIREKQLQYTIPILFKKKALRRAARRSGAR